MKKERPFSKDIVQLEKVEKVVELDSFPKNPLSQ